MVCLFSTSSPISESLSCRMLYTFLCSEGRMCRFFLRQDGWNIEVYIKRKQKGRKHMVEHFTFLLHHNTFFLQLFMCSIVFNTGLHSTSYKARWVMSKVKLDNWGPGVAKLTRPRVHQFFLCANSWYNY